MADAHDESADEAKSEAQRAHRLELMWWALIPLVCVTYMVIASAPVAERAMDSIICGVSFAAMAVTYGAQRKAAEAKAASYENP